MCDPLGQTKTAFTAVSFLHDDNMGLVCRLMKKTGERPRSGEEGSAHIDMLFNIFFIMTIFYVIASTIQLTLADVSARNSNRLALQTFQVVYDRRVFPLELQNSVDGRPPTPGESRNIQLALQEASAAGKLTGGTVFQSGVIGAHAGFSDFEGYDYRSAIFNNGDRTGCPDNGLLNFQVNTNDDRVIRTSVTSSYPWRFGPVFLCLRNTGTMTGRSN